MWKCKYPASSKQSKKGGIKAEFSPYLISRPPIKPQYWRAWYWPNKRSMEQNRRPRNTPPTYNVHWFSTNCQGNSSSKGNILQQIVPKQLTICMGIKWTFTTAQYSILLFQVKSIKTINTVNSGFMVLWLHLLSIRFVLLCFGVSSCLSSFFLLVLLFFFLLFQAFQHIRLSFPLKQWNAICPVARVRGRVVFAPLWNPALPEACSSYERGQNIRGQVNLTSTLTASDQYVFATWTHSPLDEVGHMATSQRNADMYSAAEGEKWVLVES